MDEKKRIRIEGTILKAALDFCAADNQVQQARQEWRELRDSHDPFIGICCVDAGDPIDLSDQDDEQDDEKDDEQKEPTPLPRSEWCEQCIRFIDEGINYSFALYKRRTSKARMKRAYKDLIALYKVNNEDLPWIL